MKSKIKSLLLPFYFGSIEESDRISVERELLTDSEVLVDFLDLKRSLEVAAQIPTGPAASLWMRLAQHPQFQKKTVWTLSFGAGLAAAMIVIFVIFFKASSNLNIEATKSQGQEILFDSSSELPTSSNVL